MLLDTLGVRPSASALYLAAVAADRPERRDRPRVVILRGHQANPWELRPWEQAPISDRFQVSYLRTRRAWFDTSALSVPSESTWTLRDLLPPGSIGDLAVRLPGDRYLALRRRLRGADIAHTQELGYWYSMQAARLKRVLGFRLVTTVWETIPFLNAYRNLRTRHYRELVLRETDLFLAATERARIALLLEGAPESRVRVCPPGIAVDRFAAGAADAGQGREPSRKPLILSPGRLVWEKGHQDVLRAVAMLRGGMVSGKRLDVEVCIVGRGSEEDRLRRYAHELGIADAVEFRGFISYEEMPATYQRAACMVLASLPIWSWEEQFGMVLAEAMAAGVPVLASSSGAIPEVAGAAASYFAPGDWPRLAQQLSEVLDGSAALGDRRLPAPQYSSESAAQCLAHAYSDLLSRAPD